MKKFRLLFVVAAFAFIGLVSCENPHKEADAVAEKLQNHETLTTAEIDVLINYVGEYARKCQGDVDSLVNDQNVKAVEADTAKLNKEYVNIPLFYNFLDTVNFTHLDQSSLDLINKYAPYEMFRVPKGMDINPVPAETEAGLEVQTPDSAAVDSSVIASDVQTIEEK